MTDETLGEIAVPNVLPHLSETPGQITHLGPKMGDWNDRIIELLSDDSQLRSLRSKN